MKIFEIGTGYTSIPAQMGAATEIVVEELTRSMLKAGHDVKIVDIQDENRVKTELPIIEVPAPTIIVSTDATLNLLHKVKRVVYSFALMLSLHKILKSCGNEKVVLHFHNQYNLFFFFLFTSKKLLNKAHIAYTIHSYIWQSKWNEIKNTVKKKYFQEVYCIKRADQVFVLNEQTKNTFVNDLHVNSNKIIKVLNGVNTNTYCGLSAAEANAFQEKINMPQKKIFFLAGSVCKRKNQLGALKLLLPVLKKNKNCAFVYAGGIISAEYQNSIQNFIKKNGIEKQVVYAGELTPGKVLNSYYGIASALVFPSVQEGFSLVILEAMSAGLPVLVNANSNLQLPAQSEDCCLQYSSNENFENLVETKILDNLQQTKISKISRSIIIENYSWDKVVNDYCYPWRM
jgi:glycosyltransferase involved in cell wall biosynthesis